MGKKKKKRDNPEPVEATPSDAVEELYDPEVLQAVDTSDSQIESLTEERDALQDQLLRAQAEFDNFRKRAVRERTEARLNGQEAILRELLTVLDSCEMGLESFKESSEESPALDSYRRGYELFLKSLQALLARFDVTPVPGAGEPFDPAVHEAVLRQESDEFEDGQIIDEFRRGYLFQGRLLRASQVQVAVKSEEKATG